MSWSFYISLGSSILGVVLIYFGAAGRRRPSNPACVKCEFDLSGVKGAVCPECGADLTGAGTIVAGGRVRRWAIADLGMILLLVGGLSLSREIYRSFFALGWEDRAPSWWLAEFELRFGSGPRLARASDGLTSREFAGRVSTTYVDRARIMALSRLEDTPPEPDTDRLEGLKALAQEACERDLVSNTRIAEFVRRSTRVIAHPDPADADQVPQGAIIVEFVPRRWCLRYQWRPDYPTTSWSGVGHDGGCGHNLEYLEPPRLGKPEDVVFHWSFALTRDDEPSFRHEWEHSHTTTTRVPTPAR